jgi:hypothetical protein
LLARCRRIVGLRRGEVAHAAPLVRFQWTFRFLADDTELTSDSTLRFRSREEMAASLERSGFAVTDVRGAPDRPGREFVFIACAE